MTENIDPDKSDKTRIGVISDTHGLLRKEAVTVFDGVDLIIHAGDVGSPDILDTLAQVAPLVAVRGNMDRDGRLGNLPETEMIRIGNGFIYVLHNLYEFDLVPAAADVRVVVSGHTHQPSVTNQDGVLYLNPGGAGHRRFDYPVTAAILVWENSRTAARILELCV